MIVHTKNKSKGWCSWQCYNKDQWWMEWDLGPLLASGGLPFGPKGQSYFSDVCSAMLNGS